MSFSVVELIGFTVTQVMEKYEYKCRGLETWIFIYFAVKDFRKDCTHSFFQND